MAGSTKLLNQNYYFCKNIQHINAIKREVKYACFQDTLKLV